jgi:N-acetylneuraminate synthase
LPDYQNSTQLLNPFNVNFDESLKSRKIIDSIRKFGNKLAKLQQEKVIIVASFSSTINSKSFFYEKCKTLQDEFSADGLILSFQWLPPFAWYFGGSERLESFNNLSDIQFILKNKLNICLDTSHLLMGSKYYNFAPDEVLDRLKTQIVQVHIADAKGFDGEGLQFGSGDSANYAFLKRVLKLPQRKVIEVWQGHLNLFQGFQDALDSIENF